METRTYSEGDVIVREGDPGGSMFTVDIGRVGIYSDYGKANQLLLAEICLYLALDVVFSVKLSRKPKEIFTLMALFPIFHCAYGFGSLKGIVKLFTKEYRNSDYTAPKI